MITDRLNATAVNALALQPDGKIVAAGQARDQLTGRSDFALARYLPSGRLDPKFGDHGVVITDFGGLNDFATAIALQPDGKIVVAGQGDSTAGPLQFALARYLPNGAPDTTFGVDGRVTTNVADDHFATGVAIQPDDKIVAGGQSRGINSHVALVRYGPDGTLDPAFDGDGQVIADLGGSEHVTGIALQSDQSIVAAGFFINLETFQRSFVLARFQTDGMLDTTFSGVGYVTTDVGNGGFAAANAVVLQPDGRIVAAGMTRDSEGQSDFALARYHASTGDGRDLDGDDVPDTDDQ